MQAVDFRASIIITSYNIQAYLVEAVESVMAQSLRPHEIIIADDCSSDGSRETIRSWEQQHPGWIRGIFQQENVGIPKNRNSALRAVTGNYVGILDGDDTFVPDKLEQQFRALNAVPDAKVVYGNYRCVSPDGTELAQRYRRPQPQGEVLEEVAALNYGILRTMIADYAAVKAAGFMDERYPKLDGLMLAIKLASNCRFAYTHEVLVNKKEYPESDSRRNTALDKLHDHAGIHCDIQPLLTALDPGSRDAVNRHWYNRLATLTNSLQASQLDAARKILAQSCRDNRHTSESCLLLSLINTRLGHDSDADSAYNRAISLQPDNAFIQYQAGLIALLCLKYTEAETAFRRVLQLKPDLADAHFQLGNICRATGRAGDALGNYERALELQPDHEGALRMSGEAVRLK